MFRSAVAPVARVGRMSARGYAEKKTVMEQAGDALKKTAQAFSAEGSVGKEFKKDGAVGSKAEAVGGPFSSDGAVGKQFEKDGAIGGKVQEASNQAWDAGKETKARS